MITIRPARGADRDLQIDVDASRLLRDAVELTVRVRDRDRDGQRRRLEIVLSTYEARRLAHTLLDHCNPSRQTSNDD
jgi:hypothetical protein